MNGSKHFLKLIASKKRKVENIVMGLLHIKGDKRNIYITCFGESCIVWNSKFGQYRTRGISKRLWKQGEVNTDTGGALVNPYQISQLYLPSHHALAWGCFATYEVL
jgi:hypothetical protein